MLSKVLKIITSECSVMDGGGGLPPPPPAVSRLGKHWTRGETERM